MVSSGPASPRNRAFLVQEAGAHFSVSAKGESPGGLGSTAPRLRSGLVSHYAFPNSQAAGLSSFSSSFAVLSLQKEFLCLCATSSKWPKVEATLGPFKGTSVLLQVPVPAHSALPGLGRLQPRYWLIQLPWPRGQCSPPRPSQTQQNPGGGGQGFERMDRTHDWQPDVFNIKFVHQALPRKKVKCPENKRVSPRLTRRLGNLSVSLMCIKSKAN